MMSNSLSSVSCADATARHALEKDRGQHPGMQGNNCQRDGRGDLKSESRLKLAKSR